MQPQDIKWSYSGLKDYINCPRQYHEVKVLKRFEKRATQEMLYGTKVHAALEDYVGKDVDLPDYCKQYQKQLDPLKEMGGIKFPEHRMAITFDRVPCSFGSKDYWARGIADLLVVDGEQAFVVDYKTGSNRFPDPKQLQLMALLTFAHFPQVEHVKAGLLFVKHEHFITSEYSRSDSEKFWQDFFAPLERLRLSHVNDTWTPNPTPLCKFCPVTSCEFNKQT